MNEAFSYRAIDFSTAPSIGRLVTTTPSTLETRLNELGVRIKPDPKSMKKSRSINKSRSQNARAAKLASDGPSPSLSPSYSSAGSYLDPLSATPSPQPTTAPAFPVSQPSLPFALDINSLNMDSTAPGVPLFTPFTPVNAPQHRGRKGGKSGTTNTLAHALVEDSSPRGLPSGWETAPAASTRSRARTTVSSPNQSPETASSVSHVLKQTPERIPSQDLDDTSATSPDLSVWNLFSTLSDLTSGGEGLSKLVNSMDQSNAAGASDKARRRVYINKGERKGRPGMILKHLLLQNEHVEDISNPLYPTLEGLTRELGPILNMGAGAMGTTISSDLSSAFSRKPEGWNNMDTSAQLPPSLLNNTGDPSSKPDVFQQSQLLLLQFLTERALQGDLQQPSGGDLNNLSLLLPPFQTAFPTTNPLASLLSTPFSALNPSDVGPAGASAGAAASPPHSDSETLSQTEYPSLSKDNNTTGTSGDISGTGTNAAPGLGNLGSFPLPLSLLDIHNLLLPLPSAVPDATQPNLQPLKVPQPENNQPVEEYATPSYPTTTSTDGAAAGKLPDISNQEFDTIEATPTVDATPESNSENACILQELRSLVSNTNTEGTSHTMDECITGHVQENNADATSAETGDDNEGLMSKSIPTIETAHDASSIQPLFTPNTFPFQTPFLPNTPLHLPPPLPYAVYQHYLSSHLRQSNSSGLVSSVSGTQLNDLSSLSISTPSGSMMSLDDRRDSTTETSGAPLPSQTELEGAPTPVPGPTPLSARITPHLLPNLETDSSKLVPMLQLPNIRRYGSGTSLSSRNPDLSPLPMSLSPRISDAIPAPSSTASSQLRHQLHLQGHKRTHLPPLQIQSPILSKYGSLGRNLDMGSPSIPLTPQLTQPEDLRPMTNDAYPSTPTFSPFPLSFTLHPSQMQQRGSGPSSPFPSPSISLPSQPLRRDIGELPGIRGQASPRLGTTPQNQGRQGKWEDLVQFFQSNPIKSLFSMAQQRKVNELLHSPSESVLASLLMIRTAYEQRKSLEVASADMEKKTVPNKSTSAADHLFLGQIAQVYQGWYDQRRTGEPQALFFPNDGANQFHNLKSTQNLRTTRSSPDGTHLDKAESNELSDNVDTQEGSWGWKRGERYDDSEFASNSAEENIKSLPGEFPAKRRRMSKELVDTEGRYGNDDAMSPGTASRAQETSKGAAASALSPEDLQV